jgi:hypothetical protein
MDALDAGMADLFDFGEASLPVDEDPSLALAIPDLAGFDQTGEQW